MIAQCSTNRFETFSTDVSLTTFVVTCFVGRTRGIGENVHQKDTKLFSAAYPSSFTVELFRGFYWKSVDASESRPVKYTLQSMIHILLLFAHCLLSASNVHPDDKTLLINLMDNVQGMPSSIITYFRCSYF
jgi:hypothetical protein